MTSSTDTLAAALSPGLAKSLAAVARAAQVLLGVRQAAVWLPAVSDSVSDGIPVLAACSDPALGPDLSFSDAERALSGPVSLHPSSGGPSSVISLPVKRGDEPVAVLSLYDDRPRTDLDPVVADVLQTQLSLALEGAREVENLLEQRRVSHDLYTLTLALHRALDPAEQARIFVRVGAAALDFDRLGVFLASPDDRELQLVACTPTEAGSAGRPPSLRLDGSGGAVEWVHGMEQGIHVATDHALAGLPLLAGEAAAWPTFRTRRFVLAPIVCQGRSVGVVAADNKLTRRLIAPESVQAIDRFTQQLALALTSARLHAATQKREREVTLLFAFTRKVTSTRLLDEILDLAADYTLESLGCDGVTLYQWDPNRQGLVLSRSRKLDAATRSGLLRVGDAAALSAYERREPACIKHRLEPEVDMTGVPRASLAVPLLIQGEPYGVLVGHAKEPRSWSDDQVRLLTQLAREAAGAIENARLHAETVQNLAGASLLNAAAQTLHGTLEVRERLPMALAALGQTFHAIGAAVSIVAPEDGTWGPPATWGTATPEAVAAILALAPSPDAAFMVNDIGVRPDLARPGLLIPNLQSLAIFPVRSGTRVIGRIVLLFGVPRGLSLVEQKLLAAYADQLAMALDNARLFEEAERQKTLLEHVFASTWDGILSIDRAGRIVALNPRAAELLGMTQADLIGQSFGPWGEGMCREGRWDPATAGALLEAASQTAMGNEAAGDLTLRGPQERIIRWHAVPTDDLLHVGVALTITLRDITRETEVDRMKTEFVSTVSHELRTPLTSIKGSLHLLLSDDALVLDGDQRGLLTIGLNNADRLIRLINNILDVSKIEAGRIQLDLAAHRLSDLVKVSVDGIRAFADSRSVPIAVDLADDLPVMRLDHDRIVQVLTNLLSNAIKFSPQGSRVTVTGSRRDDRVELRVIDQGRGIAAADQPRLFQRFQQLDGSSVREVGGTGLGLAICRGIVVEHGGQIRVESEPGRGATFIVELPLPEVAR